MAERAINTVTDMSLTVAELTGALRVAVERLSEAVDDARRPGRPLGTLAAVTREAPLSSLLVALLCGIVVARRL